MGQIFDEDVNIEVIVAVLLIAFASWSGFWYLVVQLIRWVLSAVYKSEDSAQPAKYRRRVRGTRIHPEPHAPDGAAVESFCYECAGFRPIIQFSFATRRRPTYEKYAECCESCGSFIHTQEEWISGLVKVVDEYEKLKESMQNESVPVDPDFPVRKFVAKSELFIYLYKFTIACLNIAVIIYLFIHRLQIPADPSSTDDLAMRILTSFELGFVCVFLLRYALLTQVVAMRFQRDRPIRVWLGVFFMYFPRMALVNAIGCIRVWDLGSVVSFIIGENTSRPFEHRSGKKWLLGLEMTARIPAALCVLLVPAMALLARLQQLQACTVIYISEWGYFECILFFRFLMDIAVLVEKPVTMHAFGHHLLGPQVLMVASEVFDHVTGFISFWATIIVFFTCGAMECYEIFKPTSALWLSTDPATKYRAEQAGEAEAELGQSHGAIGNKASFLRQRRPSASSSHHGSMKSPSQTWVPREDSVSPGLPYMPLVQDPSPTVPDSPNPFDAAVQKANPSSSSNPQNPATELNALFESLPPALPPDSLCVAPPERAPDSSTPERFAEALPLEAPFFKAPEGVPVRKTPLLVS